MFQVCLKVYGVFNQLKPELIRILPCQSLEELCLLPTLLLHFSSMFTMLLYQLEQLRACGNVDIGAYKLGKAGVKRVNAWKILNQSMTSS